MQKEKNEDKEIHTENISGNKEENVFHTERESEDNKNPVGPLIGIILIIVIIVLGAVFFWTQDNATIPVEEEPVLDDELEDDEEDEEDDLIEEVPEEPEIIDLEFEE